MLVAYASVFEHNSSFPSTCQLLRIDCLLLLDLPSLYAHIIELVLAIFALSRRRHVKGFQNSAFRLRKRACARVSSEMCNVAARGPPQCLSKMCFGKERKRSSAPSPGTGHVRGHPPSGVRI